MIRGPVKQSDGLISIELSDLLTPYTLQLLSSASPHLDPSFTERDLFRSPTSQRRRLLHAWILTRFRYSMLKRSFVSMLWN